MRKDGKKCRVYVSFMDLEKAYNRVNREALWQVLQMYDVGGKLLNGIKSVYVNRLAYVKVKGGESECFRINSGVGQGCIMSPWLFNVYMEAVMKEVFFCILRSATQWLIPCSYYRGGSCVTCRRKPFSKTYNRRSFRRK